MCMKRQRARGSLNKSRPVGPADEHAEQADGKPLGAGAAEEQARSGEQSERTGVDGDIASDHDSGNPNAPQR